MEHKYGRDTNSRGLVNRDLDALAAYKKQREQFSKMDQLETEINTVKEDIAEIKSLLLELLKQPH